MEPKLAYTTMKKLKTKSAAKRHCTTATPSPVAQKSAKAKAKSVRDRSTVADPDVVDLPLPVITIED